jgi:hypothetical protein
MFFFPCENDYKNVVKNTINGLTPSVILLGAKIKTLFINSLNVLVDKIQNKVIHMGELD